jgi:hypothetical protein
MQTVQNVWPQHQLARDVQRVGDDGDRLAAAGPQVCALAEVSRDGGGRRTAVEADDLSGPDQLGRGTSDPLTRVAGGRCDIARAGRRRRWW